MATTGKPTRGLRNNNPLNIRRTPNTTWWGQKTENLTDKDFCEFKEMKYGFRAAWLLLKRYYVKHHCTTIRQIIERWAPPSDNNHTEAYIKFVANYVSMAADTELPHPADDPFLWKGIIAAMAITESGAHTIGYINDNYQGMIMALKDDVR